MRSRAREHRWKINRPDNADVVVAARGTMARSSGRALARPLPINLGGRCSFAYRRPGRKQTVGMVVGVPVAPTADARGGSSRAGEMGRDGPIRIYCPTRQAGRYHAESDERPRRRCTPS